MTNAAYLLADQLEAWSVKPNQRPETVRGFESPLDLDAWRAYSRVAAYVTTLDQLLEGMSAAGENVAMFKSTLPSWYAGVNWVRTPWGTNGAGVRQPCPPLEIDLLRALGALLDAGDQLVLTETERRSLSDILDTAASLLEDSSATDLPKDVRRYLWSLITRAQTVLKDFETFGHEAVRQIALELGGAMHAQGERIEHNGDPASGARWKALAVQLMVGFFGGAGGTVGGEIAKGITRQITGG